MEYVVFTLLSVAVIIFAAKYFILKRTIASILRQLEDESIRLLTLQFADDDLNEVVRKINGLLEKIQQTVILENISSAALKSSIANISHDMKTPLTSVIGYLQLAKKECSDVQTKEIIKICLERTIYCNALINDFFELSLVESQGLNPHIESIDVAEELCEQILANCPLLEEKGITPHFENSDCSVIVSADKMLLGRIVQNLISNSIKYTCGDIYFNLTEEEAVVIMISNPVTDQIDTEHIFDKFYVQDQSRHDGYGIGLYLCKAFAEAMGGSIYAKMDENYLNIYLKLNKFKEVD